MLYKLRGKPQPQSTGYTVVVCNLANYIYSLVVLLDKKSWNFKE